MHNIAVAHTDMRAVEGYEDDVAMGIDGGDNEELVILDPNHVSFFFFFFCNTWLMIMALTFV